MPQVILDLIDLDTHDIRTFALADTSIYPPGFTPITPTVEITVPGFAPKQIVFTPSSIQVYNSNTLEITCDDCELVALPDGIYHVKYTMTPAYTYYVDKSFLRTNAIYAKLDNHFLKLDFMQCNAAIKEQDKEFLDTVEFFIEGAVAAAHKCLEKRAMNLYKKANEMLNDYEKKCKKS